jgi:hypothetical protein
VYEALSCQYMQAFQMLGCDVTLVAPSILPRESPRAQVLISLLALLVQKYKY